MMDFEKHLAFLRAAKEPGNLKYASRYKLELDYLDMTLQWPSGQDDNAKIINFSVRMALCPDTRMSTGVSSTSWMARERSCTSSKRSLDLASHWLNNCTDSHQLCRVAIFKTIKMPTRLLSICKGGLLLCSGSELLTSTPYLTLSHRWGQANKNCLTVARFENGPIFWGQAEILPTFQDPVIVAERLGISYLWIDSLCIIQDSEEDRARECGQMGEVYRNSHCNIAATAFMDGTQGLLRDHEVGGLSPCQISPRWDKIDKMASMDKASSRSFHFYDRTGNRNQINRWLLGERAWVMQERLLAPRMLHFAESQVYWECREQYISEEHPLHIPEGLTESSFVKQSLDPCNLVQERRVEPCYAACTEYLRLYSKCNLTRPEDKLVALAGISRCISESMKACGTPDDYLEGLWRRALLTGLLWSRYEPLTIRSRYHGPYRAPSWSWASVDDGVWWYNDNNYMAENAARATIVSAYTTISSDPFGAVSAGVIDICAPLLRIRLEIELIRGPTQGDVICYKAHFPH